MFRYSRRTLVRELGVILAALVMLLPLYLLVITAFKPNSDLLGRPALAPPSDWTFDAFAAAAQGSATGNLWSGMLNSAIITGGSLLVLVTLGSATGYTIARRSGRMSGILAALFLVGIILPFQLGMIPVYIVMRNIGLLGTHIGMILLYSGLLLPLAVFLYLGFARQLPREYEEAAEIDGASRVATFTRIVFPLLAPATGTVCILAGLLIWNDFFTQLIFLVGSDATPLPVVIYSYVGAQVSRFNVIFAALLISMIPVLTLYLIAQKKFIQGFAGGIKA
jgi:raffinose/stachyose/melibiose transport system permease protein